MMQDQTKETGTRLVYGTGNLKITGECREDAFEVLDHAWEMGFRIYDTAYSYGKAEENLGAWMEQRGVRDQIVVIDKGCNPGQKGSPDVFSGETIRQQLQQSLERLRTEHVEYYILHRDDPAKPVDEIIDTLNDRKDRGLIGRFGASNWTFERILEANAYAEKHALEGFTAVSPNYCMADLVHDPSGGSVTLSGEGAAEYRAWLEENQMPVYNYSSLGRGFLSGKFRTDGETPIEKCLWPLPIQEYDSPENRARLSRAEQLA